MGDEISSNMAGVEEFVDVDMDQLGKDLPLQGAPGQGSGSAKADGGKAVGDPDPRGAQAAPGGSGAQAAQQAAQDASTPDLRAEIAELRNQLTGLTRENRAYAALKSQFDRLQNELKTRSTQSAAPTLTPEQQSQADSQRQAEDYLKKFLGDNLDPLLRAKYGKLIEGIERQETERAHTQFKGSVESLCKEMNVPFAGKPEEFPLDPIFKKLIDADVAAYDTDPAAKARIDRITDNWDPYELFTRAMRERSLAMQAQGARVQQQQQQVASRGGRALKPGGAKPDDKKGYSQDELNAMSEEDREKAYNENPEAYEAAIPRQRR